MRKRLAKKIDKIAWAYWEAKEHYQFVMNIGRNILLSEKSVRRAIDAKILLDICPYSEDTLRKAHEIFLRKKRRNLKKN